MAKSSFQLSNPLETRMNEATRIREKYPDRFLAEAKNSILRIRVNRGLREPITQLLNGLLIGFWIKEKRKRKESEEQRCLIKSQKQRVLLDTCCPNNALRSFFSLLRNGNVSFSLTLDEIDASSTPSAAQTRHSAQAP
ncbi:hypothetical protein DY000_02050074 [Brassica cretica]|uniref:Uncharacterized protein n=1 Tax=Brassica cretica TaxID=69181 RepID=A0ABQ7ESQ3_BRACR|nr:hypothetical protein DY000_02050074 [Brassica cretica]